MKNYLLAILFSVATLSVHAAENNPNQQTRQQPEIQSCHCDGCHKNCECGCTDGHGCHCTN